MTTTPAELPDCIDYQPHYLAHDEADELFDELRDGLDWESHDITIMGVTNPMPRLMCWHGPVPYSFSGTTLDAAPMPAALQELADLMVADTGVAYDSVLANLYRGGRDSVGWHSDDEGLFGSSPTIASISLGGARDFAIRARGETRQLAKVALEHGSLVLMSGRSQTDYEHSIPKRAKSEPRINLTFRRVV